MNIIQKSINNVTRLGYLNDTIDAIIKYQAEGEEHAELIKEKSEIMKWFIHEHNINVQDKFKIYLKFDIQS